MSDLEATSSRAQSAAQISAVASGKLRAISGNGLVFAQADGLADAFAEVFARIAASSAQAIESPEPIAESESIQIESDKRPTAADENVSEQTESANVAVENTDVDVEPLIAEAEPQRAKRAEADQIEETVVDAGSSVLGVETDDQPVAESVEVAPVEVVQRNVGPEEVEAPKVIVREAQSGEPEHHGRERRESTAVEPRDNTEDGRRQRNHLATQEPIHSTGDETVDTDEQSFKPAEQNESEESSRRLRGRRGRHRETVDHHNPQPVSRADRARAPQADASAALSSEAIASQAGQSPDAASRPATRHAEPGFANVQSIAAKIQQSGTTSAAQSGTRGSTQAVESTSSTRTVPAVKPKSSGPNRNAETVSRIKLIQRVSKAFQHLGPEGGVVRLRLAPAEMGSVRVEMRINQRNVQARVVAETEAASQALREHLPDLRARLESYGMQVEKLEIATEADDRHQGSPFDAESQQHDRQQNNENWSGRRTSTANDSVSPQVPQPTTVYQVDAVANGVDVRL